MINDKSPDFLLLRRRSRTTSGTPSATRRGCRSRSATTTASATATACTAGSRERKCDELSGRLTIHRNDDELPAIVGIRHGQCGLRSGHRKHCDVLAGLLIVGMEQRMSS